MIVSKSEKETQYPVKLDHKEIILLMSYYQRGDSRENGEVLCGVLAVTLEPILPRLKPARLLFLTSENPVLYSSCGQIHND